MDFLPEDFVKRANRMLNLKDFTERSMPIPIGDASGVIPPQEELHILRMMLRSDTLPLSIPPELEWLAHTIRTLIEYQSYDGLENPFIYVTVRHGIVRSVTDDEWHVDGFSMRFPHVPEQNYIFASHTPTEFLLNNWQIPEDFDPFKHNIHKYFQANEKQGEIWRGEAGQVYAIDPYCVHRRPKVRIGTSRTFWRISFVPIEIEDDTCTQNPLFPKKTYGREDIRSRLVEYGTP